MTLEKFTIKAQEAVQEAVNTAQRAGQQSIEPVHILYGIISKGKDVSNFIFQKLGVNAAQIENLYMCVCVCTCIFACMHVCMHACVYDIYV